MAERHNWIEIAQLFTRSWGRAGFRQWHRHIPQILDAMAEDGQPFAQARIANRTRPHIDAAPSRAQVDWDANDGNVTLLHGVPPLTTINAGQALIEPAPRLL